MGINGALTLTPESILTWNSFQLTLLSNLLQRYNVWHPPLYAHERAIGIRDALSCEIIKVFPSHGKRDSYLPVRVHVKYSGIIFVHCTRIGHQQLLNTFLQYSTVEARSFRLIQIFHNQLLVSNPSGRPWWIWEQRTLIPARQPTARLVDQTRLVWAPVV